MEEVSKMSFKSLIECAKDKQQSNYRTSASCLLKDGFFTYTPYELKEVIDKNCYACNQEFESPKKLLNHLQSDKHLRNVWTDVFNCDKCRVTYKTHKDYIEHMHSDRHLSKRGWV